MFPPQMNSSVLLVVDRDAMMRLSSEAALEWGSRTQIKARSRSVVVFCLRCGVDLCCLLLVIFQGRMEKIWLMEKRDVWH